MRGRASVTAQIPRRSVLGVRLGVTTYAGTLEAVRSAVRSGGKLQLNFCNVHVIMEAQRQPALREALNHPDSLSLPDGMPLVWALRSWGEPIRDRVYGPDFFEQCMAGSVADGFKHFLYGSTGQTLQQLRERLCARFGPIQFAGCHAPPFRPLAPAEEAEVIREIDASGADIVWVGLGAPRQEIWARAMMPRLRAPVLAAVGAAFDFHAGVVKQAPDWMQDRGLEWLYRLIQEPRRLWFRYGYYNPLFLIRFLLERLRGPRAQASPPQP